LAAALTIADGCAARQPRNAVATPVEDAAMQSLAERVSQLTSLQTPAIMEYSGPSGHLRAREQFSVRRPASLRLDVMSPLGVALIIAADSQQIAVFNPSDNTLIRGPANAGTLERFTRIPMTPTQAVQLMLGLAPDNYVRSAAPSRLRTEGARRLLSYRTGSGDYELGFSDGQLSLVRARDSRGQMSYEIQYDDYRDIGAMKFPFRLQATFFASRTTIKFRYLDPSIDREIADSTFVLSPGPRTRLIELGFATPSTTPANPG
jgi:outer membrane lipoprotein-sorting protein